MTSATTALSSATVMVLALLLVANASAQAWNMQGPTAALTLQGQVPSATDPITHDIQVLVPGTMVLSITSGPNSQAPLLLLASVFQPRPNVFPTPWGGSLDIGVIGSPSPLGIEVIGDGLNPMAISDFFFATDDGIPMGADPEFNLTYSAGIFLAGVTFAFQGIVEDPTNLIFPLRNTEAVDANFRQGAAFIVTVGDEGVVAVPFGSGHTFEFHGVSYTETFVSSNGHMSFGATNTILNNGFNQDFVGWTNAEPNIAVMLADWDNNNRGEVLATQFGNEFTISYGDPSVGPGVKHFAAGDFNSFHATLTLQDGVDPSQGNFSLSWPVLDPTTLVQLGNGLMGHTPGGAALVGGAFDRDLNNFDGLGNFSGTNEAQFEEHDGDQTSASLNGGPTGARRSYENFTINKNARSCDFIAVTAVLGGDFGYLALGTGTSPDDVSRFANGSFVTLGGQTDYIGGSFLGFDIATGTVIFDPAGLAIPAAVIGIYDDTASLAGSIPNPNPNVVRDAQGLEIVIPALPGLSGLVDVEVRFGSGGPVFTTQATIIPPVLTFFSYALGNNAFQNHVLAAVTGNNISWYGVNYTNLNIGSNGQITFGAGTASPTNSAANMFGGFGAGVAVPGCAPIWADFDGTLGGSYDIFENVLALTTTVTFNNIVEFGQAGTIGVWSAKFNSFGPNSCIMDFSGIVGTLANVSTHGVSNGNVLTGSSTDHSNTFGTGLDVAITAAGGVYQSSFNSPAVILPDSIAEDVPAGFDYSTIGALGATPGVRSYIDGLGTGDWTVF